MKRGATRACSTAHHPGPSEHILGPSSRAADTSRSLFRAAYRAIDRGPTACTVRHRLGELLMLQFGGKLDGDVLKPLHAGQGGGCGRSNALGECRRPRGSSAAWPVTLRKKWDARPISAVVQAMCIGFPRRLWALGTGFSALVVLYVTAGVRARFGMVCALYSQ